jgi:general stress protein CsbA
VEKSLDLTSTHFDTLVGSAILGQTTSNHRDTQRSRGSTPRLDIFSSFGQNFTVEHRLQVDLPEVPAEKAEEFAAQVAADLSPEMSGTFGAIQVSDAGGERAVWTALGWQEDGSSVYLHIDPAEHKVELRLDTKGLDAPTSHARWVDWLLIAIVAASTTAGIVFRSWLLAIGLLGLVVGTWIALDLRRQKVRERRRSIDPHAWNKRLQEAVERAKTIDE